MKWPYGSPLICYIMINFPSVAPLLLKVIVVNQQCHQLEWASDLSGECFPTFKLK